MSQKMRHTSSTFMMEGMAPIRAFTTTWWDAQRSRCKLASLSVTSQSHPRKERVKKKNDDESIRFQHILQNRRNVSRKTDDGDAHGVGGYRCTVYGAVLLLCSPACPQIWIELWEAAKPAASSGIWLQKSRNNPVSLPPGLSGTPTRRRQIDFGLLILRG